MKLWIVFTSILLGFIFACQSNSSNLDLDHISILKKEMAHDPDYSIAKTSIQESAFAIMGIKDFKTLHKYIMDNCTSVGSPTSKYESLSSCLTLFPDQEDVNAYLKSCEFDKQYLEALKRLKNKYPKMVDLTPKEISVLLSISLDENMAKKMIEGRNIKK